MSNTSRVEELERQICNLSRVEQLWLIERVAQQLRQADAFSQLKFGEDLAAMAVDPEIQREIKAINEEFSPTEQDGLEET